MNVTGWMHDVKVAATVALGSMGTGVSMALALIPNDIGKLVSIAGLVLTAVLIRNHLRNGKKIDLENEKLRFEIRKMAAQEKERKALGDDRRRAGLPTRRNDER